MRPLSQRIAVIAAALALAGCTGAPSTPPAPASAPAVAAAPAPAPATAPASAPAGLQRDGGAAAPVIETDDLPVSRDPRAPLVDVQTLDPSLRVELRYATADNFTGAPLPGYAGRRALLRPAAARALARAHASLRAEGLGLLVYDAYRPVRASRAMVEWARRTGNLALVRDGYLAVRSRHNLGVAVDLTLCDLATGRPLDMGTAYDAMTPGSHTANAAGAVLRHRRRLAAAMTAAGFASYAREWWHFAYQRDASATERYDVEIR
ncbi:MAG: peptidase M15 [Deltaproteobacteria bacterium]|nr:peptidase M15 [Deltaproteobacteria bacterium]